jgi:outer membrane protein insertion porin family
VFQDHNTLRQIIFFLFFTIMLCHCSAFSQRQSVEAYKILGISVEGTSTQSGTDPVAIIGNSGLKVGDEISIPGNQIQQAIKKLWALRIFSDIQILEENKVENGIYLLIKVKEYPRLERVEILGRDDVSEDDIMKKITVAKGQILTSGDVNKIVKNVIHLYEEENHLLATVTPQTVVEDTAKSNNVVLKLKIDEGPSVTIDKILFTGNKMISEGDLKGTMDETHEKTWWWPFSHPRFNKKKYEEDKQRVLSYFRKNGYLDAEIISDSVWYSVNKEKISIQIDVREGAQYKIHTIAWEGNTVYKTDALNQRLGFRQGDIYDQERYIQNLKGNSDQSDVVSLYRDNGYLTVDVEPEVKRVGADSVDIINHLVERHQFRIGQVNITGNTKTHDNVIRRELYTRPGDFFNQSAMIRSIRQLSQLQYFNPEKLNKFPDIRFVDDKTVDIGFEVEEKGSDNVNASVGYSGAFGLSGALGFTINNFSVKEPLSGGAGQALSFDWQFGEGARFRTFSLSFTEPWVNNTPTTLGVSLFDSRQVYVYDYQQTGLTMRVGRRLKWPDDFFRVDWTLRFQGNNVHDNGGNPFIRVGKTTQYSIGQTISRNSTDSPIFPSIGSIISLSVEVSGGPFLPGNVDYHKWLFNAEWFTPLFSTNRLVLYTSTSLGYLEGFKNNSEIPPIEYFYMGGTGIGFVSTTPLRGYDDRTVGPMDDLGREIGGRTFAKHTAELRLAVTLNPIPIYLIGFMEGGNVYQDFNHADFLDVKRSYGFGARLLINPIGLIGFDYGYGVDDVYPKDGKPDGWRFHFQFGRGF